MMSGGAFKTGKRIQQHREAEARLYFKEDDGRALADVTVVVCQVRHKFLFGGNIFLLAPDDSSIEQRSYQEYFATLLNYATLPFYWGSYEPEPGKPDEERLQDIAGWCLEHDIVTKGHPLCWHTQPPKWHADRSREEMRERQMARIRREVSHFHGRVDRWDVVNEAIEMPGFTREPNHMTPLVQDHGVVAILREAFSNAREANPEAVLILNDFDHTEAYARLIEQCLDSGIEIDAIGIQSHMHLGYLGRDAVWDICERFARFGKPLHWTEVTLLSGDIIPDVDFYAPQPSWPSTSEGEARQAEEVADFYTVLYSHPAVEAITWWDFKDGGWLGAPAGLLREDMTPKPAYERLKALIKQDWWFGEQTLRTDAAGKMTFRGPLGDYELTTSGKTIRFRHDGTDQQEITLP